MSEESESVKDWMLSVGPNTRPGYMYYLREFCKFVGHTPDQLVKEGVKDRTLILKASRD